MVERVCVVSLLLASVAHGGTSFIELVPDRPGMHVLDATGRSAPDRITGARLDYGFDEHVTLHRLCGNLVGGQPEMEVVPEPATVLLLVGAGWMALRRRS